MGHYPKRAIKSNEIHIPVTIFFVDEIRSYFALIDYSLFEDSFSCQASIL